LGISHSSRAAAIDPAAARAEESAKLPPAFGHLRLGETPAPFRTNAYSELRRVSLSGQPQIVRRHPLPPPRRTPPPIVYGGGYYGGYWPDFGLGFGFPLWFDFFNYFNWFPSYQYNAHAAQAVLLYLNDGSALEVTDYWVEGDMLNYVTEDGKKGTVPVANVDVQRTTDANARVGLQFRLDRTQRGLPLDRTEPSTPYDDRS
jgi:hypothetical protein